ncbi:hypothetical protein [Embleya sp. MST-111070]
MLRTRAEEQSASLGMITPGLTMEVLLGVRLRLTSARSADS